MSDPLAFRTDRTPLVPPAGAELHARDMTATFSADLTLAQAQVMLAELGQWLPIDGDASLTLEQLIETNSTGPLRLGYGAWRDLLLGCQFRNGRGELITAGGRTVKNVAGYDLTKFVVGQRGIFAQIITITSRTYRRPVGAILARFDSDARLINRLLPTPCRPQWIAHTAEATWCGYMGDQRTMDYYRGALNEYGPAEFAPRSLEADIDHRAQLWRAAGVEGSFRAAVPPVKVLEFARAAGLTDWAGDGAFGIVIGIADGSRKQMIQNAAREVGGSVYFVEDGKARMEMDEGKRELLRRLKMAFDGQGKLVALVE